MKSIWERILSFGYISVPLFIMRPKTKNYDITYEMIFFVFEKKLWDHEIPRNPRWHDSTRPMRAAISREPQNLGHPIFFKNKSYENKNAQLKVSQNLKLWWKDFATVNQTGCLSVMAEHLQIHVYSSDYLESSIIWSNVNIFVDKTKNICFGLFKNCSDLFWRKVVKLTLTLLKRNFSPIKL